MEISKKALSVIGGVGVFLLLAVIGALIAVLVLTSGGGGEAKAVETTRPSTSSDESAFLEAVRGEGITGTDDELLELGQGVCDLFDEGKTFQDFVDYTMDESASMTEAEQFFFFVGASVGSFCIEHADEIRSGGSSGV